MKTHLLIAIRHVRKREREAMEQRGATSALQRNFLIWRRYQYLAVMPLSIRRMTGFYVRSNGLATSKGEITRSALSQAGIDASFFQPPVNSNSWQRLRKVVRMLARVPIATPLALRFRGRLRRSRDDIGIVIAMILLQRMLERNPYLVPVINSDLSSGEVMLACAAQGISRSSVWWQDDFHYTEPVPFHVTAGAILNRNGLDALQARNPNATILKRVMAFSSDQQNVKLNIRVPAQIKNVGVAVNGLFCGNEKELRILSAIQSVLGIDQISLRLHPTAKELGALLPGIQISPRDESVDDFSARMDVVFAGNSAIQYKMLLAGTPVIHIPELDPLNYDLYRYVERRLVFGSRELNANTMHDCKVFYESMEFEKQIEKEMRVQFAFSGCPLSEISRLIPEMHS